MTAELITVHLHDGCIDIHLTSKEAFVAVPHHKGFALEPRHVERDVAGGRGEVLVVVTAAVALTGLAALIAGRLRQGIRLLFQQLVQGFFYTSSN